MSVCHFGLFILLVSFGKRSAAKCMNEYEIYEKIKICAKKIWPKF